MQLADETIVIEKTRELCQTILDQPSYQEIQERVTAFLADDQARSLYQTVSQKGEVLREKQRSAQTLTPQEITDFEQQRDVLLGNPVARGFIEAQEEMQRVQSSVQTYVAKTFQLGRVPANQDLQCGTCSPGCSCG